VYETHLLISRKAYPCKMKLVPSFCVGFFLGVAIMHYYKRNIGDYAKRAARLTMLQHGAYTLLHDSCYDREQFPTLDEAIEWTWASSPEEIQAVEFVLKRFFKLINGQYVHEEIQKDIAIYHEKSQKNRTIAIEREAKRKELSTKRAQNGDEASPNHKPLTKNHKPITTNQEPETINEEPKNNKTPNGVSAEADYFHGVDDVVIQDFLKLRKAKKSPVTETAVKGIEREATKAGLTLQQALEMCCARGWTGFKAEWIESKTGQSGAGVNKQIALEDRNMKVAREWRKMMEGIDE